MIKAIALDDEPLALEIMRKFAEAIPDLELIVTFTQTAKALEYLNNNRIDLLLLDIDMPTISGIEFYRQLTHKPLLVFTTAYEQYALEGFDLDAVDFLLKPYTIERFKRSIDKVAKVMQQQFYEPITIIVKSGNINQKIETAQITFIEGLDNYIKIHLNNGKSFLSRKTIKAVMEQLPASDFLRIHKSYIVGVKYIAGMNAKSIMIGDVSLSIGSNHKQEIKERLDKYFPGII